MRTSPRKPSAIHNGNFPPHLSLVQSDFPLEPGLRAQGKALIRHIYDTLPAHDFLARSIQLIEFYSDDWAGKWWETLSFKQLQGWELAEPR